MRNQVQLITYVDRLSGGGFRELQSLMDGPLAGLFGGAHLLPFFWPIDGTDAGFDPIDHTQPDSRLGTWEDVGRLARGRDLMADLIVNHVSSLSPQFQDFCRQGDASSYADLFLTYDKVFPNGATEAELLQVYRLRTDLPFTACRFEDGTERLMWTTFTSGQLDIDVQSAPGRGYLDQILYRFREAGITAIRLDAAGFAIKKAGTSCFMLPETFDFISALTTRAHAMGMEVLVEIHGHYEDQIGIAKRVDWVYDFALPPLVLHAFYTRDAVPLKQWLAVSPRNALTVLDTHDGIGLVDVAPDRNGRQGFLTPPEVEALVKTIHQRSNGESREASGAAANNLDLSQINCSFYSALGQSDTEYLIARAIQFFSPGIPQVYYVGLLAGRNDMELLRRSGEGRDINRHYYNRTEVDNDLARPVVRSLMNLMRFRSTHPAFSGEFRLLTGPDHEIGMQWQNGNDHARLHVDLQQMAGAIIHSAGDTDSRFVLGMGS
ncbi:MAG TPA: sucrose phosphorylase [Terriglobia bacterium]|nr:sucrose phosphorylase [Terriglobia bacterium]